MPLAFIAHAKVPIAVVKLILHVFPGISEKAVITNCVTVQHSYTFCKYTW